MFEKIREKFLYLAERTLNEAAWRDRRDRFKTPILVLAGLTRLARGLKKEALAYFNCAGLLSLPDDQVMISSEDASYYEILENEHYQAYLNSARDLVVFAGAGKDDEICDIGCGRGFLVRELQRAGYGKVAGLDNSEWAVEHRVVPEVYHKKTSEYPDGVFKVVSLISVLEHTRKADLPGFLREISRITSDCAVCCIPLYPNNLFNFFLRGADHRIFERREWWDARFAEAGFVPGYLPEEPTPFILPFVYRRRKSGLGSVWSSSARNVVRMRMGIGDELCALPAIAEVKKLLPGARIAISRDTFHKEIFQGNPAFEAVGVGPEPGDNIVEFYYQTVFDRTMPEHFALQAGLDGLADPVPRLYLSERETYPLKRDGRPCLAVDTRANWVSRKWEHSRFEAVARALKEEYGLRIIEVGRNSPGAPEFLEAADVSYADKLSLRQTASVISQCDGFLGSDSGLSHLAAAVGTKAFTLFGPVDARWRIHRGLTVPIFDGECYGCYSSDPSIDLYTIARRCPRGHHKCMRKITPEAVAAAVAAGLGLRRGRR